MFTLSHLSEWLSRGNGSQSRPAGMPRRAAAAVEPLEGRRMFAVTPAPLPFVDAAGVLQVSGTNKADVIVVALDVAGAKVNVTVNGVTTAVDQALVTGNAVHVSGGNGGDSINVSEAMAGEFTMAVTLLGGNGKDTLAGGSGADTLDGGNGNDALTGNGGDDTLRGGNGKDVIAAGEGNDSIDGGRGRDSLLGDAGADHFLGKKQEAEAQDETLDDLFDAAAGPKRAQGR